MTKTVSLGEICVKIISGGTPSTEKPEFWGGNIPWITSADIKDHYTATARKFLTDKAGVDLLPAGNILVVTRVGLGKLVVNQQPIAFSQDLQGLILKPNVDRNYLVYVLSQRVKRFKEISRGATIKGVTRDDLVKIKLPLPTLPRQRQIAAILDRADALRQKDRQLLEYYDQLAQSTFIDLYGDGQSYEQWPLGEISKGKDGVKCGPFGTQLHATSFQKQGVPLWGIRNVNKNFNLPTHEFLTADKARELRTYNLLPGDLVMTRKGTVGNCALYPEDFEEGIMHSDLLRIRLDNSRVHSLFINYQLKHSEYIETQIQQISNGAIMAGINVTKLKLITVFVPPLPLQQHFATIIERIERQKAVVRQQIAASEALFQRLLQDSFGD